MGFRSAGCKNKVISKRQQYLVHNKQTNKQKNKMYFLNTKNQNVCLCCAFVTRGHEQWYLGGGGGSVLLRTPELSLLCCNEETADTKSILDA